MRLTVGYFLFRRMTGPPMNSDGSWKDSMDKLLDLEVVLDDDWYEIDNIVYDPLNNLHDNQYVYVWNEYAWEPLAQVNGWDKIIQEVTEHGPCEDKGNLLVFLCCF
jgi:hypothetical protein